VIPYLVLFIAIVSGVMCASLEKAGVGRAESLSNSPGAFVLMLITIPLNLLTNLGLIAIVIWSLFALDWLPSLLVAFTSFVGFSLAWGGLLARLRRSAEWASLVRVGIPLVFVLKLVTAISVALLVAVFGKWIRL
jgi:hypothetical protein